MIGAIIAGISVASSLWGAKKSSDSAKSQKELAKKQAKASKNTMKLNYKTYSENAQRDYFNNMYDMSSQYSQAISQLNAQYRTGSGDFMAENASDYANMSSSYYNDMKSNIDSQYDRAMTSTTSQMRINDYRTRLTFENTSKQKFYEYKDNLQRAELQLQENKQQAEANKKSAMMNGLFNVAQVGVQQYYNGNIGKWTGNANLAPTLVQQYQPGTSSYTGQLGG